MRCQRCGSERVAETSAKCDDNFSAVLGRKDIVDEYVPPDLGIGGNNTVEFSFCLDCGQIQGAWPRPETDLERLPEE